MVFHSSSMQMPEECIKLGHNCSLPHSTFLTTNHPTNTLQSKVLAALFNKP